MRRDIPAEKDFNPRQRLPATRDGYSGHDWEVRMKARLTLLVLALVVGGPVLAQQVQSISTGVLVFAWMLGIAHPRINLSALWRRTPRGPLPPSAG
ncbi:hypothetical protein [Actinophytocola sp.]|uniref:hypothetical protein n=1 Tax=Actinophytocola sp. TaxID=1872138 RepID=UPI002ED6B07F